MPEASEHSTIVAKPYAPNQRRTLTSRLGPILSGASLVLLGVAIALGAWFLFTAKRVEIIVLEQDGTPMSATFDIDIAGGVSVPLSNLRLMRTGHYKISIQAPGYFPHQQPITVDDSTSTLNFRLERTPGLLSINSVPSGASLHLTGTHTANGTHTITANGTHTTEPNEPNGTHTVEAQAVETNGTDIGEAPVSQVEVPAGDWRLVATLPLYKSAEQTIEVEGRGAHQTFEIHLDPNFAPVNLTSNPSGARLIIDETARGTTPASLDLEAGVRRITIAKDGYASHTFDLQVEAGTQTSPPRIELQKASARLMVQSAPEGAVVLVDGDYQGVTPLTLSLAPERAHRVNLRKTGYEDSERQFTLQAGASKRVNIDLIQSVGEVIVRVSPEDVTLLVDGRQQPAANTRLSLSAEPHRFEFRRLGYESQAREITPRAGFSQRVDVRLLTIEDARLARMKPEITTASNQKLVLLKPTPIELGASRREAGRRANEALRKVPLTREFYLATREVSNAEFRAFAPGHSSGTHAGHSLDGDTHPAVGVSWTEAARYCNWLSEQDGLNPVYQVHGGRVVGSDITRSGYRLPTEAEWAWAARYLGENQALLRMPWGDTPKPPERHGNYADTSATYVVSRVIFGYQDNYIVSAPVGSFAANVHGIFDLGGNVAEWAHDFYEQSPAAQQPPNPTGPAEGEYHVIRGSSWMHGSVSDLRLSYRDYGIDGRPDLGFRIAKYVTE